VSVDVGPLISVAICTKDRPDDLARAVASILADDDVALELIVIDQTDGATAELALEPFRCHRLRYVRSETMGKGAGLQEALTLARSPYVVLTDDDCVAPPGWVRGISRPLLEDPKVALVFSTVETPSYDRSLGYIPAYSCKANRLVRHPMALGPSSGLGAAMAVRRDALLDLGGIDESFGPGARFPSADDVDLELRFLLKGWHVFETAEVAIVHHGFRTLAEGKEHTVRDWSALGACLAKPIRAGHPVVALLAVWLLLCRAVIPAVVDLVHLRKPKLRRLVAFGSGFTRGLAVPVDRRTLRFRVDGPQSRHRSPGSPCAVG
jgi:glycosyltransferase involved in cell wall biosynthesis